MDRLMVAFSRFLWNLGSRKYFGGGGERVKEIKKHLILWGMLVKNSLMSSGVPRQLLYGHRHGAGVFFWRRSCTDRHLQNRRAINGLTPDEVLVFFGTYMVATGPYAGLYMMNPVRHRPPGADGEMDLLLGQARVAAVYAPRSSAATCRFHGGRGAGIAACGVGLSRMAVRGGVLDLLGYLGYLVTGSLIAYSMFLLPQVLAFRW
jgi:ABC-2 type transport system permease protein